MDCKLYKEFLNPGTEYRGKPFWAWNGKLDKDELLKQIHVMKEMGFGGFFMHSRTGLATEYLGEEWFELINACADEAEKLGMEAWLYDEDRWPSGTAGGMVTIEPRFRLKFIHLEIMPSEEFHWHDNILAAFSCRLEGFNCYDCKRIYPQTPGIAYEGSDILVFTIVEMEKSSFYNGYTYVDTLNREATERFLELTHEKYKKYCGDRLGKSIKGIFTDEPHRGTLMDGFGISNRNKEWCVPWTYELFANFKKKYGYSLVERLPELFLKPEGKPVSQVKWHYVELVQEMFLDNFVKPIYEWCRNNNLILTGHFLHEDSLAAQTSMVGSIMRCYEYMEYPGVDILTENSRSFWVIKQLFSVAHQLGKKWLLSELYGCTGWQMPFEGHKAVGDWQALFGINFRCHHLSWYTMEGEAKRDYPASILHQSTWWREYKHVEEYFARIGVVMSQGRPCCEVLVINPVESVWCQVYPGWSQTLMALSPEVQDLEYKYRDIFHWLTGSHIDFDYGDEEMMARLSKVESKEDKTPVLRIGEATYKIVIVAGLLTIRSSTLRILNEFIEAGGTVIFAGEIPSYVDALESKQAFVTEMKAICVPFTKECVIKTCLDRLENVIQVLDAEKGETSENILVRMVEDGSCKYVFAINTDRERSSGSIKIRIRSDGFVEEWLCFTGECFYIGEAQGNGVLEINTSFAPAGEHLFVIKPERDFSVPAMPRRKEKMRYKLEGLYQYELDEPNVCVLDMVSYSLDGGEYQGEMEILKVDRDIRTKLGLQFRGGEMFQPWFVRDSTPSMQVPLNLKFRFHIADFPEEDVFLAIENPDNFQINVNGNAVNNAKVSGWWVDRCFAKLRIDSNFLVKGENVIELRTCFTGSINLESIYLLGRFGVTVSKNQKTITSLPQKIRVGDLVTQGLPFYSGKIKYMLPCPISLNSGERAYVHVGKYGGACIKVHGEDGTYRVIAWQPNEADITDFVNNSEFFRLEVVLTRRNTFGPLHLIPPVQAAYGPDSFISEGENFTMDYVLLPSGLLSEPEIIIMEQDL